MKTKIIILLLLIAGFSCKKDDPYALPQAITGTWKLHTSSVTGQIKSARSGNGEYGDTSVYLSFSGQNKLIYLEVGNMYKDFQLIKTDTVHLSATTYKTSGNKLSINNLVPLYKPFLKVKDYTFLIHKPGVDTTLTIHYEATEGDLFKRYELDFSKL